MIEIVLLQDHHEEAYEAFITRAPQALFFASTKYRRLLKAFLGAEDQYFLALQCGEIRGVLPAFLSPPRPEGRVANSLPFYGSHGAVIEHAPDLVVRRALLDAFHNMASERKCLSATIITSPFEPCPTFYEEEAGATFTDHRTGQLTPLPNGDEDPEGALMLGMHQKTRNVVRRAARQGFELRDDASPESMAFLVETHADNMRDLGGLAKPPSFFQLIPGIFEAGTDYRIVTALYEGRPVAAILLFYYNRVVEYFTPVVQAEYRPLQPLSFLIFECMKLAARDGFHWWNWGGTWFTQEGVYRFKTRWGAQDRPYHYYTRVFDEGLRRMSAAEMLRLFPHFYVMPFAQCASEMVSP